MTPRLLYFERVDSTMDLLHQLAADGVEAGTAVLAGEQLGGRGSRGRSWQSPPGGLWLSVLFRPAAPGGVEVMSLRVGLAVAEALDGLVPHPVRLKWPNDLMLGERKVGGILCEARWQGPTLGWVAVGVGMNVRNAVPQELNEVATALASVRPALTVEDLVQPIVSGLRKLDLGADRLTPEELKRFAQRDWLSGRDIRAPAAGRAAGLREDGALLVRPAQGGEIPLRSGSVELAAVSHTR
ncbi:MAG TPA: biotin--[acetyl-CoA-carboxylase] ligase [Gemmatimonadales bacterium]|jgi:BirA family biotin operon repressor/biotin-[acetyl-CoA-carboxylase] ligase|nr:biotin--[acetyl-CoA-carboxylase] ligase [Gemmatimonadales bacterium]